MEKERGNTFRVVFSESPQSSSKTKQQQPYHLVIDKDAVRLRDPTSNDLILEWPYSCVRRYGTSPSTFSVEVGRRSATGEGVFAMVTTEAQAILDKIHDVSKQIMDKRGPKKTTTPQKDNVYTEPYTQWPLQLRDNRLKSEVLDEKSKESGPAWKTAAPCLEIGDGVTVTRIGQGSELEPTLPPRLEPPIPPRLEPTLPPRLEPTLPPRLEPTLPPRLEPPIPPRLEPALPPRLELTDPHRSEPRTRTASDTSTRTGSDPRTSTGIDPRASMRSGTGLYLTPTFMDTVGVTEDLYDDGEAAHVAAMPTPKTRDDPGQETYWTSTSVEPPICHNYEPLKIVKEELSGQVDMKPQPGRIIAFDLPKRERPKQPRVNYENVKGVKE
ncbi:proteoglycan 4-like [Haliotis cracherodii]|uniref:proteoglycan 4-like n=1 Tax=Haliotis cracherodii TaxID=6455 RepID=UPI0039E8D2AF